MNLPAEVKADFFEYIKDLLHELGLRFDLNFIFQNDNKGAGSSNTGFFMHFRQGNLNFSDFTINNYICIRSQYSDKDGGQLNINTPYVLVIAPTPNNALPDTINKLSIGSS